MAVHASNNPFSCASAQVDGEALDNLIEETVAEQGDQAYTQKGGYPGTTAGLKQELEDQINSLSFEGVQSYDTLADLQAVTPIPADGTTAKVAKDTANPQNNGNWYVSGGAWVQFDQTVENVVEESNTSKGVTGKAVVFSERENNYKTPKTVNSGIDYVTNRFNKDTITLDNRLNFTNGDLVVDTSQNTSDFIPIYEKEKVLFLGYNVLIGGSRKSFLCFYDINKVFISGNNTFIEGDILEIPTNAYYLRISYDVNATDTFMVLCGFQPFIISEYIEYNKGIYKTDINKLNDVVTDTSLYFENEKNYFNKDEATDGYFVNYVYGYLTANASRSASNYIKVREGFQLTLQGNTGNNSYCWYNSVIDEYFFYEQGANSWSEGEIITVPDGVNYIRFAMNTSDKDNIMLLMGTGVGIPPKLLEEYKAFGESKVYLKDEFLDTKDLIKSSYTRNAFVVKNSLDGYRYNIYSGDLVVDTSATISLEYVPISEGDIISSVLDYSESSLGYCIYNEAKTRIAGEIITENSLIKVAPINSAFIRTYTKTVDKYLKLININSPSSIYVNGGKFVDIEDITAKKSMFNNMKWVADGDSITAGQTWQPLVVNKYGLGFQNIGIGGQKYSGSLGFWATSFDETDDIANSFASSKGTYHIPYDAQFVTLMGGANDWGNNAVLGTQDSTDTDTFLGGFNKYLELFYANFPTTILIVMSPTLTYKTADSFTGWENTLGLSIRDYSDALEERCRDLGIPFVDILSNYGVTKFNHALYTPDRIHPNALGGEKIAGALMGYMDAIDNFNGGVIPQNLDYDSVTNGTFSSATGWTLNDWSVTGGSAVMTDSSGTQLLSQDIGVEVGKTYRLKYRIKDYVQGDVTIGVGGYISTTHNTNGTFIKELEVTNALSNSLLEITALNTFTGSIDYIIVQEIL